MVGGQDGAQRVDEGRGFPTDLPVVGGQRRARAGADGRGFPTDLPVVGAEIVN